MKLLYRAFLITLFASCFPAHDPATIDRSGTACVNCHLDDYNGTSQVSLMDPGVPDHGKNATKYPQTCADCHNTQTWYSHPEALFSIQAGAHANVQCTQCHANPDDNTADALGANTQCASCHPATEVVAGQTLSDNHIKHPDAIFPQNHKSQNGTNWKCTDCHSGPTLSTFDGYSSPPAGFTGQNFCLSCHPNGKSTKSSDASCSGAPCHQHSRAHHISDGDPSACLNCHPGGGGGGG